MQNQQMKHVVRGAFILSLASLVTKILSAVYRVPFQNLVGNTGFYVYQQIYPLYGLGMTFALSGLPVFISKLIAEQATATERRTVLHYSSWLLVIMSLLIFSVLQFGKNWLAQAMGDPQLAVLIGTVAWLFLLMPWLAVSRGFFQGNFTMVPTALSQVTEQIIRVTVILAAAAWSLQADWSVYKMGAWAMSGAIFGGIAASFVLLYYWHQRRKLKTKLLSFNKAAFYKLTRRFLVEGGSLCLFTSLIILLQLLDSFTIKSNLVTAGLTEAAAKNWKGIYDRGQPLVQLGLVVATSLAATLLPSLTQALHQQQRNQFYRQAATMVRFSFAFSLAAAGGLIALMPGVNRLLFGSTQGDPALMIYMVSIVLIALISGYNSVFQSLGEYRLPIWALVLGFLVKLGFNGWAVRRWQILGASLVTVGALAVILSLIWWYSRSYVRQALFRQWFSLKLFFCVGSMMAVVAGIFFSIQNHWQLGRLATGGVVLICVISGAVLFISLARWVRLFTIREWLSLPMGKQILRVFNFSQEEK